MRILDSANEIARHTRSYESLIAKEAIERIGQLYGIEQEIRGRFERLNCTWQLANTVLSKTVSGIPTNAAPIYVRLWTQTNGSTWQYIDYTYTAF